jgi:hypothetical protein
LFSGFEECGDIGQLFWCQRLRESRHVNAAIRDPDDDVVVSQAVADPC